MPSAWSAVTPASTAFGLAALEASASVIALSLLPLASLQSEPGDQDRRQQEWDHGGGDGRSLAEIAAADGALIAERRHQVGGISGPTARQDPDELEIGEGEQYRESHHHGDDGGEQGIGDVAEYLPAACAVDGCRLVQRGRHGLQSGEESDGDERHAAPDVGKDNGPACVPSIAEEIDIARDQPELAQRPRQD